MREATCAECNGVITRDMFDGKQLVDNYVYKLGELQYIELAHAECMPEWSNQK